MRAMSSAVSITMHVALGAAVLFGTARTGRSNPTPSHQGVPIFFPQPSSPDREPGVGLPTIGNPDVPDMSLIALPSTTLQTGASTHSAFPTYGPSTVTTGSGQPSGGWAGVGDAGPELLSGPLPVYPELLRQAGVQGQVVLEAVVDTTGRVQTASISVVSATHPEFVAPARQALVATLFRPARVGGRAVPMLVRVPFDFTIRGGM